MKSMKSTIPNLTPRQKATLLGDHADAAHINPTYGFTTVNALNGRLDDLAENPLTVDITTLTRNADVLTALLDRAAIRQRKPGSGRTILIVTI
jgi:hypothetical protein